jgi:SAM-dependent methyltransferase
VCGDRNSTTRHSGFYSRMFARYYDRMTGAYEKHIADRKRELFGGLDGTILEIGPGTGANMQYFPRGSRWIGVEPNPHMHDSLRRRAEEAGVVPELHTADAAGIDVGDAVADVAVSTLVLCSVPDVDRVLSEVRRALRPGGRLLFIVHVAAPPGSGLRLVQRLISPVWYVVGDGCRVTCETGPAIERAGFSSVSYDTLRIPQPPVPPWVSPHVIGQAVR